jgi:peptidoglycan hydrolase-like protein with peptidoglycan-binding domain
LQTYLMSTGDYTYADGATGYFGQVTKAAVQSWQTKNQIFPAAGYFGPISQGAVTQ